VIATIAGYLAVIGILVRAAARRRADTSRR